MESIPREEFPSKVMDMVRGKFPLVRIVPAERGFAVLVNGHLAQLENLYRTTSVNPSEMQYHVNRWMVELLRAGEGNPDEQGPFEVLKDRILPMVLASGMVGFKKSVVWEPLVEGLIVAYAIDSDRTISYLTRMHFERWKMEREQLRETAIANLVAKSQAMNAHAAQDENTGEVSLIIFQQMDGYDASRILLPSLHEKLRSHLGSPFVAAIPNRDILLCLRDDEPTVARLRPQIREDFMNMPHQISEQMFLVTPDGIAPRTK